MSTARLFFAAWPPSGVQEALHAVAEQARRECGGRAIAQRNLHATLAFLGDVPRDRLAAIESVADGMGGPRSDLTVDRLRYWKHNRIVWAGVERCPEPLLALAGRLSGALRATGFRLDDRPYVLHVTLLRNARHAPASAAMAAVAWPVDAFALVESVPRGDGRAYEVLRQWPLGR